MIIDVTVILLTATATATAVNDIAVTVTLNDEVVNPEESFCERVDNCLGISEEGSATKFLNEQGDFVPVQGGGGGSERIVVSSNITASLDVDYTLVASATFTDPTPAEGKGYSVLVRNGTATIGGTAYSIVGQLLWRVYHSGAWATYQLTTQTQLNAKQDSLGYTPENAANKATNFNTVNDILYPTVEAVTEYMAANYQAGANPITQINMFTHLTEIFPGIGAGTTGIGVWEVGNGWVLARNSGSASSTVLDAESGRAGLIRNSTGASNSYVQIRSGNMYVNSQSIVFKTFVRIQTLSGGGQTFNIIFGMQGSVGGTVVAPTDCIRFNYTDTVNSGKWQIEATKASATLAIDTGVTVAIDTDYDLIITKDTSNRCYFYINGVLVGSITAALDISTYVPTNLSMYAIVAIFKTGGSNARTVDFDYALYTQNI